MPKIRIAVGHDMPEDDAVARLKKCLGQLAERYSDKISDVVVNWHGNSALSLSKSFLSLLTHRQSFQRHRSSRPTGSNSTEKCLQLGHLFIGLLL